MGAVVNYPEPTKVTVLDDGTSVVVSLAGAQGPPGPTGATGATGAQGPAGADGSGDAAFGFMIMGA